jgi:hypothetical protein
LCIAETRRLRNIYFFMQVAIQEGSFEVQEIHWKRMMSSMSEQHTVRSQSSCGCPDFIEVNAPLLRVTFSHQSSFVALHIAIRPKLVGENPAKVNRSVTGGQ